MKETPKVMSLTPPRKEESQLTKALRTVEEENVRLRREAVEAHTHLVILAMDIGWATDGKLTTGVRHVEEYVRRLRLQISNQQKLIDELENNNG